MTKSEIKNLEERIEHLSEEEQKRRHAAFAAHWFLRNLPETTTAGLTAGLGIYITSLIKKTSRQNNYSTLQALKLIDSR